MISFPRLEMTAGGLSVMAEKDAIQKSGVPLFIQAGWLDGASAASAIQRFNELQNSQRLLIGPWNRQGVFTSTSGSKNDASPLTTVRQWAELLSFFDRYLRDEKPSDGKQLFYYTSVAGTWKIANQWPPAGATNRRLYFSPDLSLGNGAGTSGSVTYTVNTDVTSGLANRWRTQVIPALIRYPSLDAGRLTFTSSPLPETRN
jgi:putative CocE/NonD family hydrolase